MSYIVKNCPAITEYKFPDKVHKDCCQCTYGYCKNIDCIIKQVIEKCTNVINTTFSNECFELAKEVTNLFDIEETNE